MYREMKPEKHGGLNGIQGAAELSRREGAFTLIELLVVIAIIAILAAVLLPVLSAAKKRGSQAVCINNQKQLSTGMQVYLNDNNDAFPGIASRVYGYQPEDWIYWRTNTALYPPFSQSPILTSVPGLNKPSLRCPMDTSDADRLAQDYPDGYGPYLFSYSFTGYGLANDQDVGMSSIVDTSSGTTNVIIFKQGMVRSPVSKIMMAEEPGSAGSWDTPTGTFISDVAFADGHVEPVTPDFGSDPANSEPDL
jgi:prepilin-type N-terminal cleavage/methylation domain-containing protein/prepilin-type processing-associated H-X9-DG protein